MLLDRRKRTAAIHRTQQRGEAQVGAQPALTRKVVGSIPTAPILKRRPSDRPHDGLGARVAVHPAFTRVGPGSSPGGAILDERNTG